MYKFICTIIVCLLLLIPVGGLAQETAPATPPVSTPADASTPAATPDQPATTPETPDTSLPASPPASLNPDISVIGNMLGSSGSHNVDPSLPKQHCQLDELEVVVGSKIYPGVSGLGVFTVGGEKDSSVQVEEGYITVEQLLPIAPIGARAGILRLPFGKANPLHPHAEPYADTPAVINNLLGEFRGNGAELVALIPTHSSLFLEAHLGRWKSVGDNPEDTTETFGDKPLTLGRLWASLPIGESIEAELGASAAYGAADPAVPFQSADLSLQGVDTTWRFYLPHEQRIELLAEGMQRKEPGTTSRGFYVLGTYRPGHFYEFGSRYDWCEAAQDSTKHESYVSLFATRFLSEMTYLRLQVKSGTNEDHQHVNEIIAQVVFGFGPHTHPLQ